MNSNFVLAWSILAERGFADRDNYTPNGTHFVTTTSSNFTTFLVL